MFKFKITLNGSSSLLYLETIICTLTMRFMFSFCLFVLLLLFKEDFTDACNENKIK